MTVEGRVGAHARLESAHDRSGMVENRGSACARSSGHRNQPRIARREAARRVLRGETIEMSEETGARGEVEAGLLIHEGQLTYGDSNLQLMSVNADEPPAL